MSLLKAPEGAFFINSNNYNMDLSFIDKKISDIVKAEEGNKVINALKAPLQLLNAKTKLNKEIADIEKRIIDCQLTIITDSRYVAINPSYYWDDMADTLIQIEHLENKKSKLEELKAKLF